MKILSLLILFPIFMSTQSQNLDQIRIDYRNAISEKDLCREMLHNFDKTDNKEIYLAYYGALQAIWAKHTNNPFEKLRSFNSGKKNLDSAITQRPDLFEARFLRYGIQKQSPAFLNYKNDMKEDRDFLMKNIGGIQNPLLKQMGYQILKN